jgi:hypothetical protein
MALGLKQSTLELLKRFNRAFPQFYEQFVSSEIQLQNLRLAETGGQQERDAFCLPESVVFVERYFWGTGRLWFDDP